MAKESIKDLTEKELSDKLKDYSEEMRNLRIQTVMGQLENKKRKWFVRKKIAQIKTILHEFKIGIRKNKAAESKSK
jgi:large subunit ribosomal protein L29